MKICGIVMYCFKSWYEKRTPIERIITQNSIRNIWRRYCFANVLCRTPRFTTIFWKICAFKFVFFFLFFPCLCSDRRFYSALFHDARGIRYVSWHDKFINRLVKFKIKLFTIAGCIHRSDLKTKNTANFSAERGHISGGGGGGGGRGKALTGDVYLPLRHRPRHRERAYSAWRRSPGRVPPAM